MITKKTTAVVLAILITIFIGCSAGFDHKNPDVQKKTDPLEEQVKNMTIDEKVGQMVIVGLEGYTMDEYARNMIENYHVGGFILFGQNIKSSNQLIALINSLKGANIKSREPLFMSVDEEGGRVSRMPSEFKKLPSCQSIGKVNNSVFSYKIGSIIAEKIKSVGFNMDFAPVLDINSNSHNPVIGDRSFGKEPEIVSKLGIQTMKGIMDNGVVPVVKHFPGHGDTSVDSHVGLPSVDSTMERLKSFELIPFKNAIKNHANVVMTAHILLNKIDPHSPASMSKTIITDILRKYLKFEGVIITDDMTMGAIVKNYNISNAAIKSVNAGSDIVLVCHGYNNQIEVINTLKKAIKDGTIPINRVNESVCRILKLKQKYNLNDSRINSVNIEKINAGITALLNANLK